MSEDKPVAQTLRTQASDIVSATGGMSFGSSIGFSGSIGLSGNLVFSGPQGPITISWKTGAVDIGRNTLPESGVAFWKMVETCFPRRI